MKLCEEIFSARRIARGLSNSTLPAPTPPFGAAVTCLAEMPPDSVSWLWGDVLAQGKVTLLTGASGVGKSFVALQMAADVTRVEATRKWNSSELKAAAGGPLGASAPWNQETWPASRLRSSIVKHAERDLLTSGSEFETPSEIQEGPGNVLLISPEVELGDVVRPRLQAAGADMTRVHALRGIRRSLPQADDDPCRAFQLDEDLRLLEDEIALQQAAGTPLRLIVIDPFPVELFAYRYGTADLMRTMRELAEIAAWSQAAILVVTDDSIRLSGSWGNLNKVLHATAQSVWTVVDGRGADGAEVEGLDRPRPPVLFPGPANEREPRDDEPEPGPDRLLLSVKANLKQKSMGLSFRLVDGRVEWNAEPVDMTAEQFVARRDDRVRSSNLLLEQDWSELARATDWLKRRLGKGMTPLREIKRAAQEHDISHSTLRRAFCGLKGDTQRIGNSRLWGWSLPEHDTPSARLPEWLNVEKDEDTQTQTEHPRVTPQNRDSPRRSPFEEQVQSETEEPQADGSWTDEWARHDPQPDGRCRVAGWKFDLETPAGAG